MSDAPVKLSWRQGLFGTHSLEAQGDTLLCTYKGPLRERRDKLSLSLLDPNESIFSYANYQQLVVSIICLIVSLGLIIGTVTGFFQPTLQVVATGVVVFYLLPLGVLGLVRFSTERGKYYLICYKYSGQQALVIPRRSTTIAPVEQLLAHIARHAHEVPVADSSLAGQLAHLGELHRKGLLTDEEFRLAKERVIGKPSRIGFHPNV